MIEQRIANKTAKNITATSSSNRIDNEFNYPGDVIEYELSIKSTGDHPLINPYIKDVMSKYIDPETFVIKGISVI